MHPPTFVNETQNFNDKLIMIGLINQDEVIAHLIVHFDG